MSHARNASDAERMDRHYRYQRYLYDSTRTHYLIGRQHLIGDLKASPGQSVLEIGCGTAWNLIRVARLYPRVACYGIDVSNEMLATASAAVWRNGLSQRISLGQGDAISFNPHSRFDRGEFDRVFFSYALSMIPRWQDAFAHAAGMIAPGGSLVIVDFGQCGALPGFFKTALFAFLRHYSVTPRADLDVAIRRVAAERGLAIEVRQLHRGYTDYAVLTRKA
jgi:S-adenosylmethionine-diacylgycerolhomoserine-N-methlytransferase